MCTRGGCIDVGNHNKAPNYSDSRITHDETTNYDSSDFENITDLINQLNVFYVTMNHQLLH